MTTFHAMSNTNRVCTFWEGWTLSPSLSPASTFFLSLITSTIIPPPHKTHQIIKIILFPPSPSKLIYMLKLSWAISKSSSYFCPLMLLSSQRAYCDLSSVTDPIILYKLSYFLYKLVYHSFAKTSCLFSFTSGICSVSGWLIMTHCSVTLLFYSSLRPLYWVTIYTSPLMKSVRQGGGWGGIENWKAWFFKTFSLAILILMLNTFRGGLKK